MGSASSTSKEHVDGEEHNEQGGSTRSIRRIDSAGVTTPGGGFYPDQSMLGEEGRMMEIDDIKMEELPLNESNDIVPMVFKWELGGRNVAITGTFNGWSKQVRFTIQYYYPK